MHKKHFILRVSLRTSVTAGTVRVLMVFEDGVGVAGGQSWREPRDRTGDRNFERDYAERGGGRFDDYHRVPSFERTSFSRTHSSGWSAGKFHVHW